MAQEPILIGVEDGVSQDGAWAKNGAGDSADQVSGFEASHLEDDLLDVKWRSQDLDYGNTRIIRTLDRPALGRLGFLGRHNLSEGALARLVVDRDFVERPVVEFLKSGDLGAGVAELAPLADWSFCTRLHVRPIEFLNTPKMRFFAFAGPSFSSANRQFELRFQTSPLNYNLHLVVNNFTSTETTAEGQPILPGWYDIAGRYRSSDGRVELWVGGVLAATATAPAVTLPARNDLRVLFGSGQTAHFEVMDFQLWGRWIEDSEITGYRAAVTSGSERDLVVAYHFQEAQGSAVASTTGGNLALSGAGIAWRWRTNPFPDADTGVVDIWHDWVERQALRVSGGDRVETAATYDVPRSITAEVSFRVDPSDPLPPAGQDAPLLWFGTSYATAELAIVITDTGHLLARSHRNGSLSEAGTLQPINDGAIHHVRAILDGLGETLYVVLDGSYGTSDGVDEWTAAIGSKLMLGSSAAGHDATATLFEIRLYGDIRTGSSDRWQRLAPTDPELLCHLDLDGDVVDDVADTATTLTGGSWETVRNPKAEPKWLEAARPGIRGEHPLTSYPRRRPLVLDTKVEWRVALLQIWDRHNPDGWVSLGRFGIYAAIQPKIHRVLGSGRRRVKPGVGRTSQGAPYAKTGASYDVDRFRLGYLDSSEANEVFSRLLRRAAQERPVLVITEPSVEPHQLIDRSLWGIAVPQEVTEKSFKNNFLDIVVEGVE